MTTLEDQAEDPVDVTLAADAAGAYRLESVDLAEADDLTEDGEFPQHGRFLAVTRLNQHGEPRNGTGREFLECPQALAAYLVDEGVSEGDTFTVSRSFKTDGGRWDFVVDTGVQPA